MTHGLGPAIRAARLARGRSQRALARQLERRHSVVSRWEAGILEPTVLDLARVAKATGVSPDVLLAAASGLHARQRSSRLRDRRARQALGRRLSEARQTSGVPLSEVIRATGIRGRRIVAIELGADPSLGELRRLVRLYGVTLARLLSPVSLDSFVVSPLISADRGDRNGSRSNACFWMARTGPLAA